MMPALLEPAFVRELEALRRRMQVRARSGGGGEHLARRRGGSAEFLEHRAYAPGDDLRRMDWLAFARTGDPIYKLFRAEEDAVVRLLVDATRSMDHGTPTKLEAAKRLAASIGYMALADSERAQVLAARSDLHRTREPVRGRASLQKLLRQLEEIGAEGETDLTRAIDAVVQRSERPGMLVVLSDFFDPGAFDAAISRAASAGHDVALVQVLAPDELSPAYEGDLALEDVETGAVVEVTVDGRAIDAYLARLGGLFAMLHALAKRLGATYIRIPSSEPLLPGIRRFVARAVD